MLGLHTRARRTSLVIEWFACNPTVRVGEWFWRACVRHGTTRRFAPRFERGASRPEQPRPHSADTCARSRPGARAEPFPTRQVTVARGLALSALFGQRTTPDSPAFRPLHFAQRTATQTSRIASLRSDGAETVETGRTARALPENERIQRPRCFAYRPRHRNMARCSACRPGDSNMAARLRPARTPTLAVSTASFRFTALRETVRPHWKDKYGLTPRRQATRQDCR